MGERAINVDVDEKGKETERLYQKKSFRVSYLENGENVVIKGELAFFA